MGFAGDGRGEDRAVAGAGAGDHLGVVKGRSFDRSFDLLEFSQQGSVVAKQLKRSDEVWRIRLECFRRQQRLT